MKSDDIENKSKAVVEPKWMTAKTLSEKIMPTVQWLWHGFIGLGFTTLFSSKAKAGKTSATFDFMKAAAEGRPFLGQPVNLRGKILLLSEEPLQLIKRRIDRLGLVNDNLLILPRADIKNWADVISQAQLATDSENVELIVVDTLASFWDAELENDAHDVIEALQPLQVLSQKKNVGLLLIHHLRKMQGTDGSAHRGSGALLAIADIAIELHRSASGGSRRDIKALSRFEETALELTVEQKDGSYSGLGSPEELQHSEISRKVIDVLFESGGVALDRDAIMGRLNPKPSNTSLKEILAELLKGGRIVSEGKGTKGSPLRYRIKPNDEQGGLRS